MAKMAFGQFAAQRLYLGTGNWAGDHFDFASICFLYRFSNLDDVVTGCYFFRDLLRRSIYFSEGPSVSLSNIEDSQIITGGHVQRNASTAVIPFGH